MVFSSINFMFIFFPLILIIYFIVPRKLKNIVLLIFSLVFYAWGEPVYIVLLIFSSIVDYVNGIMIEKYSNSKKKKIFLILSICINIGLLSFFKYGNFVLENINSLLNISIPLLEVTLPIGISFYTFQTMSYSIDVYRGAVKAEKNFLNFMTYVSLFPQLIAGPIVRYKTISDELKQRTITYDKFAIGFLRFIRGLGKKVLIANNIGLLFEAISSSQLQDLSVISCWLGIIAYGFQIFFDFSGYSDMAIGLGKMLGFTFEENFNYPYISKSITEFWRRWHISLSTWFRDYLYIPLGGSRCSKIKNIRNILIVWLLTGLWHGSAWNFIIWGIYFGILLILEKFILSKFLMKMPNFIKHIYAIFFIIIGWLIFAFDDIDNLVNYGKIMFGFGNVPMINNQAIYYLFNYSITIIICIVLSTPIMRILALKRMDIKNKVVKTTIALIIMVCYIGILVISTAYLVDSTYNPFMYFRF